MSAFLLIGRLCSADPFVQAPGNSQGYNRYSYCFNNPLSLTDPTGFITWGSVWHGVTHAASSIGHAIGSAAKSVGKWVAQNWRTVVVVAATIVVSVVTAGVLSGPMALVASTALGGAVNGGLTTAIYGGSISQIFISALKGAGAAVGGAAYNMIQGDWRGAAISAGASLIGMAGIGGTGSLAIAGRAVMAAAVGGTVAKLNGGSFANGAITAAFASVMGDAIRMATSPRAENSNSAAEEEFADESEQSSTINRRTHDGQAGFFEPDTYGRIGKPDAQSVDYVMKGADAASDNGYNVVVNIEPAASSDVTGAMGKDNVVLLQAHGSEGPNNQVDLADGRRSIRDLYALANRTGTRISVDACYWNTKGVHVQAAGNYNIGKWLRELPKTKNNFNVYVFTGPR